MKEAVKDEVLAHPDLGTNKSAFWKLDSQEAGTGDDVDAAIDDGPRRRRRHRARVPPAAAHPRLHGAAVHRRSTRPGEQITMWSATQIPHILRFLSPRRPGMPESKVRVIAPDVGGGFGGKLQTTPEEFVDLRRGAAASASRASTPRPAPSRSCRATTAATSGRSSRSSASKDGTVTGFKVELLADLGAYVAIIGGGVPVLGAWMFNSIYKFPAYQFNCQTVLTNKTWVDAYRGAGRPEATFGIERMMDELAAELGRDPLEVREKNWITHEEFPFTTVAGMTYDSGNYEAATARAKELFGYDELRAEQQRRRESNDPVQLGIGSLDLHRDVRPRPVPRPRRAQLRRRRLGAREHPDARRPARSRSSPGRLAARPGPRDGVEPDRRRPSRRAVRGRRGAPWRHADQPQGPRHLRLALARRRWRGARAAPRTR